MKRAGRQALTKGMNVVYIYHDTIDEAGHTESFVFSACDTAIDELRSCIHNRLSRVWKWEIMTIDSAEETEIS